jgi:hypothetical protein
MMDEKDFMQEEFVSKELEIEINTEILKLHTAPCYDELKAFALHFIEWQKEQMKKDAVETSEELEKAANKHIRGKYSPWLYKSMVDCFKAGAQWLKNKIIKED